MKSLVMKSLVMILSIAFIAGCGYTTRTLLPPSMKTVNVAIFENQTYEYQIENTLANEIANEFIIDGRLELKNAEQADMQLTGNIVEYHREPLVYDEDDEVTQYRIQVFADVSLKDLADGSVIWEGSRIKGEDIYFVTGDLANTEEEARLKAFRNLAKNIVEAVIEGW